ncbi:hypothetical protein M409DRAFT_18488 [Zasmidium cellare ATCC 36951]|uniref:Uncharacterized protein n=1 Tax=Zasmidium cellare ATCC 36951 TaxID=1080233 RepID=A0A6A6CZQ3_ZASCE|nr:uncharacterized protein M409DRAFT_18488 [Zasmidium cellare ATCC 36951]KAF2171372.1 hypothetical protein M409DRAFT_18488 [Zasmidium cellare ATCC 36951]
MRFYLSLIAACLPLSLGFPTDPNNTLSERQCTGCAQCIFSDREETLSERDRYKHRQLTDNISCGAATSCTAGYSVQEGYSFTWSASVQTEFASAGFEVQMSWTTGTNYECDVDSGETGCVWFGKRFKEYTVRRSLCDTCTGCDEKDITYTSPTNDNSGAGDFYCVTGSACRSVGQEYWADEQ